MILIKELLKVMSMATFEHLCLNARNHEGTAAFKLMLPVIGIYWVSIVLTLHERGFASGG